MLQTGMRVKAYRNLNNGLIGLRCVKTNKVLGYCRNLVLSNCEAKVGIGTRNTIVKRLQETGKREKSVHAFIIGNIVSIDSCFKCEEINGELISYNPYKADHFYFCNTMKQWNGSDLCYFSTLGKGYPLLTIAMGSR